MTSKIYMTSQKLLSIITKTKNPTMKWKKNNKKNNYFTKEKRHPTIQKKIINNNALLLRPHATMNIDEYIQRNYKTTFKAYC